MINEFLVYIISKNTSTTLVYEERKIIVEKSLKDILKNKFLKNLTTYEGVRDAIKHRWGICYNIPIIISKKICLFKVNQNTWINYHQVLNISSEGKICLKTGEVIDSKLKIRTLKARFNKMKKIIDEINDYV